MRAMVIGTGRMGRLVREALDERGHTVSAFIGRHENAGGSALTPGRLKGIDVAIEFTTPTAAPANIARLLAAGVPVVSGTTGWFDQIPAMEELARARGGALLVSANFSVGVHVMLRAAKVLGAAMAGRAEFEGHIIETHHKQKKDAPSGTAIAIQSSVEEGGGKELPITSLRLGHVPGTHDLLYEGPHETLRLSHVARDRDVFASGAVIAAEWLVGRTGVYSFEDVLFGRTR
jgi:4-hydroxy-tetrahydrodipicolinate reductase